MVWGEFARGQWKMDAEPVDILTFEEGEGQSWGKTGSCQGGERISRNREFQSSG